ncbi:MAG: hypothetical protein ACOVO7_15795, partial [Microcystis aeruginosa]
TIKVSEKQPGNYGSFCGWCISSSLPRQDDNCRWGNKKRYKKVIVIAITEVSKKEMNNVKTLRPARINLGFVGWIRINLTGYIEKYKISRGITKEKYGSYLNDEAVSKTRLGLVFLRNPVSSHGISIVRAY